MDILADENADAEWVNALRKDGHNIRRVSDIEGLGPSSTDKEVLETAVRKERVVLTADKSDFGSPPFEDHRGIVIVTDINRSGGEVMRAVRRIDETYPDLSGKIAYVSDWL